MARVVIVGGGISGLAIALALRDQAAKLAGGLAGGLEVVLLEATPRVGGNIHSERFDGFIVEKGPNGFLDNVPATPQLITRVGLDAELVPASPTAERRYLFRRGRLWALPTSPLAFFGSGLLSLRGRLRVLLEPFARRHPGHEESVHEFASRRIGDEAASILVGAMVSGVFAGDPRRLSLPSAFPKMAEMEAQHGSLVRAQLAKARARRAARRRGEILSVGGPTGPAGRLTSLRSGLDTLPTRITAVLGDVVRVGHAVDAIEPLPSATSPRWRISLRDTLPLEADAVVATSPAGETARMLGGVAPRAAAELGALPTAGLVVVALAFDAAAIGGAPAGFGFLVPRGEGPRILGCLWDSSIFPRAPEGQVLMRAMIGGALDPGAIELDDHTLLEVVLRDLATTMGLREHPTWTRIYRWPRGIAQYTVGHQQRLEGIRSELATTPGLWIAGSSYDGIAMNANIEKAPATADVVLGWLASNART